jgi:hypothetical protein
VALRASNFQAKARQQQTNQKLALRNKSKARSEQAPRFAFIL